MSEIEVNGVRLYYELHGEGPPLALVHGSWVDANGCALVTPALAQSFRVMVYDRRGHSRSERPETQGSVNEDGDDLAALLEALEFAPAHVVTNSYGGNIALRLAARRPEMFRSLSCHEPPVWSLLAEDPGSQDLLAQGGRSLESVGAKLAQGDHEGGARQFVDEVAFGPGAWEDQLPPEVKETFVRNAPTFLDELQDPDQVAIGEDVLARIEVPLTVTGGTDSPPTFGRVIDRLVEIVPGATREQIEGSAHVPQLTTPERFVEITSRSVREREAQFDRTAQSA